jgi:hypothetical protein
VTHKREEKGCSGIATSAISKGGATTGLSKPSSTIRFDQARASFIPATPVTANAMIGFNKRIMNLRYSRDTKAAANAASRK